MSTSPRHSGARTRSAVAIAAGVVLAAGLAGCGDDGDDTATDPAATPSATDTSPSEASPSETAPTETTPTDESGAGAVEPIGATGSAGVSEATLVSATEVGGSPSTLAFALDTDMAVADFAAQFAPGFADAIGAEVEAAQAPASTPYAATVAVGCDAPTSVRIDAGEAGFEVSPTMPTDGVECVAPMTYVVVFAAPDA